MQFTVLILSLAMLAGCMFIGVTSLPTKRGDIEVEERSGNARLEFVAPIPIPGSSIIKNRDGSKSGSLGSRAHGPGGDSDSDSDCATSTRRSLKTRKSKGRSLRSRAHGPGGDSGSDSHHDSDSDSDCATSTRRKGRSIKGGAPSKRRAHKRTEEEQN